ncbi:MULTISPECIES: M20 aminoacylase family protein [unclassified Shinella]|uniref:M20 aminoacylase family protein n=1 Tax=unclassified Shinella TaxID=2643062 RepID=UPI00234E73ED|nr:MULTISPECIES: M20 aminoacylase family protein [unclassified Shinella]MCO5151793.1 M20 family metallopeptidase [Shinella sp.]MDC7265394.1 amidohydrolase [Shinella sp. HY16]MDC7272291.1 amidohydrolase [Shinella sp. YZ44]
MPHSKDIAPMLEEIVAWRHDFHRHPELQYEVHRTAGIVAEKLAEFGCDQVVSGIGRTGVVGLIHGSAGAGGPVIGLRADMDALPIMEETGCSYASQTAGLMHACGHDGHTAMLLGAAKYLAATRRFAGSVAVIFQPAEEGGGGANEMVKDGLLERFGITQVYGMHNMPGLAAGTFGMRTGPIMAAADRFRIEIDGRGGHAARPHDCIDPILVGAQIVSAAHSIVARNVDPLNSAVLSFGAFNAGFTDNVIPNVALLKGTVRTLNGAVQDLMERRLGEVVDLTARTFGATARLHYLRDYPVTVNADANVDIAFAAAAAVAGTENVDRDVAPMMGSEDFAFMLQKRPGAYIFLGQGKTAGLHHPKYDFNDDVIPAGVSYWIELVSLANAGGI